MVHAGKNVNGRTQRKVFCLNWFRLDEGGPWEISKSNQDPSSYISTEGPAECHAQTTLNP